MKELAEAIYKGGIAMMEQFSKLPKAEQRKQAEKLRKAIRLNKTPKFKPEK